MKKLLDHNFTGAPVISEFATEILVASFLYSHPQLARKGVALALRGFIEFHANISYTDSVFWPLGCYSRQPQPADANLHGGEALVIKHPNSGVNVSSG